MKRLTSTLLLAGLLALGCDSSPTPADSKSQTKQDAVSSAMPESRPAATAAAEVDPVVASAGMKLNETEDLLTGLKFDEAEANLKALQAVKSKLTSDDQHRLEAQLIALHAATKMANKTGLTPPKQ